MFCFFKQRLQSTPRYLSCVHVFVIPFRAPPHKKSHWIKTFFSIFSGYSSPVRRRQTSFTEVTQSTDGRLQSVGRLRFVLLFLLRLWQRCEDKRWILPPSCSSCIQITSANKWLFSLNLRAVCLSGCREDVCDTTTCCLGLTIWSAISPSSFVRKGKTETLECPSFFFFHKK